MTQDVSHSRESTPFLSLSPSISLSLSLSPLSLSSICICMRVFWFISLYLYFPIHLFMHACMHASVHLSLWPIHYPTRRKEWRSLALSCRVYCFSFETVEQTLLARILTLPSYPFLSPCRPTTTLPRALLLPSILLLPKRSLIATRFSRSRALMFPRLWTMHRA